MSEQKERKFAEGFFFKRNEKAPDWVIGQVSIKVEEAIAFLQANKSEKGWVNLDILKAKEPGKTYMQLNEFKPTEQNLPPQEKGNPTYELPANNPFATQETPSADDDLPF